MYFNLLVLFCTVGLINNDTNKSLPYTVDLIRTRYQGSGVNQINELYKISTLPHLLSAVCIIRINKSINVMCV